MHLPVIDQHPAHDPAAAPFAVLAALLRGELRLDDHNRALYATDASIYQVQPVAVVIPADIDDVRTTINFCHEHHLPVLPRGGGTSLAGQTVNRAVVIDFSVHCNTIIDIAPAAKRVVVEPGVILNQLNRALAPHTLMFGPDVATADHANIGGMIGNNSAGAHSILYGRTVEHLIAADVLLADGTESALLSNAADPRVLDLTRRVAAVVEPLADEIDDRFPKIRRHVNGYNLDIFLKQLRDSTPGTFDHVNLAHLIAGSEGTLAVTTRATLNLVDAPALKSLAIIAFPSVDVALDHVAPILSTSPAAVELIDDTIISLAAVNPECRAYITLLPRYNNAPPGAVLYVEYFSDDPPHRDAQHDLLMRTMATSGGSIIRYDDQNHQAALWSLRKHGEPLLYGMPDARKPLTFIEDVAVDPAQLPAFIRDFRKIIARHNTTAAYYAHASVGCLHIRPRINLRDPADRNAMQQIAEEATDLVRRYGGALSGEHGDGRLRSHLLERFYGPRICDAFRAIKHIFDPHNLLNPGNIISGPPMTADLRINTAGDDPAVDTFFRYTAERGFRSAIELCNGAGVCRKPVEAGGTMCPSYHATRDERHSTRGRGNALRCAILSPQTPPRFGDRDTLKTLDLCLSCKACKAECPSNVDMARYKSEYLAQSYRQAGRTPLRARAVAHIRALNRLAARWPRLCGAVSSSLLGRAIINRALDIDPRRSLPRVRSAAIEPPRPARATGTVILFADCFSTWNEPHIVHAAMSVLHALGLRIITTGHAHCCGRSAISVGALDIAQSIITRTAGSLAELISEHTNAPILFLEPSCLSAITDDWLDLTPEHAPERTPHVSDRALADIASRSMLIEQFLAMRIGDLQLADHPLRILLHGHCHQKALWGSESSAAMLRSVPGAEVMILNSGCCGMAGYFGYTREHYDLSMKIGELSLFSTLRQHDLSGATICTPGTSCRHQLRDGMGIEALHPVEVVAAALGRR